MPSAALERHPDAVCDALRGIEVSVTRVAGGLQVSYRIEGEIERLRIPAPRAARVVERLWQHTCCEIFIAPRGAPGYREFNLSPSGEWAAYDFSFGTRHSHCGTDAFQLLRTVEGWKIVSLAVTYRTEGCG